MNTVRSPTPFDAQDPLSIDSLLMDDEKQVRDTIRGFCAAHVLPHRGRH